MTIAEIYERCRHAGGPFWHELTPEQRFAWARFAKHVADKTLTFAVEFATPQTFSPGGADEYETIDWCDARKEVAAAFPGVP